MHKNRFYIDTSVFGGYFDNEFEKWTKTFFDDIFKNKINVVISDLTLDEITNAPNKVKQLLNSVLNLEVEILEINDDVEFLAYKYIENKAISSKFQDDALHIACSTIFNVDALISWNFKHIVNFERIKKYNSVNLFYNYKIIDIRTPAEVINEEI